MFAEKIRHVFLEELQHVRLPHHRKIVNGKDRLNEIVLLLRKIPLRSRDDPLVAFFQTNTEPVQDLADVRLAFLRVDLQPHVAEIADCIAIVGQPNRIPLLVDEDLDLVIVRIEKGSRDERVAAARRQKWIDQSQSVNLWIKTPDLKSFSHMYRQAWHVGLKTTYYLRSLGASNIEKATVSIKKEVRGHAGAAESSSQPKGSSKKTFTAEQKLACSIEAMRNGGECEACQ